MLLHERQDRPDRDAGKYEKKRQANEFAGSAFRSRQWLSRFPNFLRIVAEEQARVEAQRAHHPHRRQHCENDEEELKAVARDRALQRKLFDGGFAGICVPKEYGGQDRDPIDQFIFFDESMRAGAPAVNEGKIAAGGRR